MFEKTAALWNRLLGRSRPAAEERLAAVIEDERRVWVRFPADVDARVVAPSRGDEPGLDGRISDISRGGARLMVKREFEPGELLTVVLPSCSGRMSLANGTSVALSAREPAQLTAELRQYLLTPGNASSHQNLKLVDQQQIRLAPGGGGCREIAGEHLRAHRRPAVYQRARHLDLSERFPGTARGARGQTRSGATLCGHF